MTDVRTSPAGQNVSSLAIVSADQVTIMGDGTAENPLRAATADVSSGDFTANFAADTPVLGNAMRFTADVVRLATASGTKVQAAVVGLVVEFLGGSSVRCRFRGPVELTTAEWDIITGETGGLTVSEVYYLSDNSGVNAGELSVDPGSLIVQIGVALNATTMLVGLPAVPAEDL